jgi:small-conductance mechanosensitive channel
MRSVLRALTVLVLTLLLMGSAWSQATPSAKPANAEPSSDAATLVMFNRPVVVFRSSLLGASPKARVDRARFSINEALNQGGKLAVSVKNNPEGQLLMIDERLAFVVTAGDVDPLRQDDVKAAASQAARQLEQIIAENREARDVHMLLTALGISAIATFVFGLMVWLVVRLRVWLDKLLVSSVETRVRNLKIGGTQIIEGHQLVPFLQRVLKALRGLVILLLTYEWASFLLSRFPYTRAWGERLNDYLLNVIGVILHSMLEAVPGLGIALAIFMLARVFIGFLGRFFERMVRAGTSISWLSRETMPTTRRLFSIGIWLFAIAMAYPYLPGAETDAFKGLSVLLGVMVSLGASSIVGQGAAGLILTYTSTIRPGEYVRIGEHEGTVVKMGMFTTTIRTGLGEELTLPNSMITGTVTKNYSRRRLCTACAGACRRRCPRWTAVLSCAVLVWAWGWVLLQRSSLWSKSPTLPKAPRSPSATASWKCVAPFAPTVRWAARWMPWWKTACGYARSPCSIPPSTWVLTAPRVRPCVSTATANTDCVIR